MEDTKQAQHIEKANKGPEVKFYPHGSGRKGQSVTLCDSPGITLFHMSKEHTGMERTLQFQYNGIRLLSIVIL